MYDSVDEIIGLRKRVEDQTATFQVGAQTPHLAIALLLHLRIVDLSGCAAALLKAHEIAGIPHLVRGQLEALVDLLNLLSNLSDIAAVAKMDASHCEQVKKVLKAVVREGLGGTHLPIVTADLKAVEDRLAELEKQGITAPDVADRFRAAKLIGEYYSVYSYLCGHTHNGISALEEMHLDTSHAPPAFRMKSDEISKPLAIVIELSIRMPIDSLGLLMAHFQGASEDDYTKLRADFNALRAKWAHLV